MLCKLCNKELDLYGRHGITCKFGTDVINYHNTVRDDIEKLAISAGYKTLKEEKINNEKKIPADLIIINYLPRINLIIDVTSVNVNSNQNKKENIKKYGIHFDRRKIGKIKKYISYNFNNLKI